MIDIRKQVMGYSEAPMRRGNQVSLWRWAAGLGLVTMLGACVQVTAPSEPIEINLNINIRQEIVYRLDSDARELIENNAEIF